jgi:hypothetical protein
MALSDREQRLLKELEDTLSLEFPQHGPTRPSALRWHKAVRASVGLVGALVGLWLVVFGVRVDSYLGAIFGVAGYGLIVCALDAALPRRFKVAPFKHR